MSEWQIADTSFPDRINWEKCDGLVPAIVQDSVTGNVLMLGYMNEDALRKTREQQRVTFYSRTRNGLWTKGETSGHWLKPLSIRTDCDGDCLLIRAQSHGPVCHNGSETCFGNYADSQWNFLLQLQALIESRKSADPQSSYTARLLADDVIRVAQKLGEESVETVLAAASRDDHGLIDEAADLLYHLMVMLSKRNSSIAMVIERLIDRHCSASRQD